MTEEEQEITIVDVPDYKVLGMRNVGEYKQISTMLPALFEHAVGNGARHRLRCRRLGLGLPAPAGSQVISA